MWIMMNENGYLSLGGVLWGSFKIVHRLKSLGNKLLYTYKSFEVFKNLKF